jgi:hypothetical protein
VGVDVGAGAGAGVGAGAGAGKGKGKGKSKGAGVGVGAELSSCVLLASASNDAALGRASLARPLSAPPHPAVNSGRSVASHWPPMLVDHRWHVATVGVAQASFLERFSPTAAKILRTQTSPLLGLLVCLRYISKIAVFPWRRPTFAPSSEKMIWPGEKGVTAEDWFVWRVSVGWQPHSLHSL